MSLHVQEITDRVFLVSGDGGCRFPFSYSVLIRCGRVARVVSAGEERYVACGEERERKAGAGTRP